MNVNFLMHPEFFIFDRMTKKERELYKEASLVKTNNKIIVQKFRVQFTYACMHRGIRGSNRAGGPLSSWLIIIFIL